MFLMSNETLAILLLCVCIIPIAILIVIAFVLRVIKAKKANDKEEQMTREVDPEIRKEFYDAYGGESNVLEVVNERSKIKIKVKDVELIDGDKIRELGALNVLIIGDEVRASFSDRAEYVYNIMK